MYASIPAIVHQPPSKSKHLKDFLSRISFFHANGLSRHNLRHPRLSQSKSWRKKKKKSEREREVTACGTSIAANFFSHEKRLHKIYLNPQRNGAIYQEEKSPDLWTWLSERAKMWNRDGKARLKINIKVLIFFQEGVFEGAFTALSVRPQPVAVHVWSCWGSKESARFGECI